MVLPETSKGLHYLEGGAALEPGFEAIGPTKTAFQLKKCCLNVAGSLVFATSDSVRYQSLYERMELW